MVKLISAQCNKRRSYGEKQQQMVLPWLVRPGLCEFICVVPQNIEESIQFMILLTNHFDAVLTRKTRRALSIMPQAGDTIASATQCSDAPCVKPMAWVTLLTRTTYLPGVQGLARSMQAVNSGYPLIVMYTSDTVPEDSVEALRAENCEPMSVDRFIPDHADFSTYKLAAYGDCWTKLRIWQMNHLSRVIYIDADMLLIRNMDALFDLPSGFYAGADCYAGRLQRADRERCPLFRTFDFTQGVEYFNAGLFVCEPGLDEFDKMCEIISDARQFEQFAGFYAEQDFLNWYFKDSICCLPYVFNAMKIMRTHHPEVWNLQEIFNIHFVDAKPWDKHHPTHSDFADLNDIWWHVFETKSIPAAIAAPSGPNLLFQSFLQTLKFPPLSVSIQTRN